MTVSPIFLTREQAAEACQVSVDTIRRAINAGKLRAKKSGDGGGGKYLLRPADLEAWFDALEDA